MVRGSGKVEHELHPGRLTWNPKNGGLEDDFPFQRDDVHVPCYSSRVYQAWDGWIDHLKQHVLKVFIFVNQILGFLSSFLLKVL